MSGFARGTISPGAAILTGTFGSRPAPQIPGRLYYATDWPVTYRDTGTTWVAIADEVPLAKITAAVTDNADLNVDSSNPKTVLSYTIPANVLAIGTVMRLIHYGVVNPSFSAAPNINFKSTIGGTASGADANSLATTNSIVADTAYRCEFLYTVTAIGAGATAFQNESMVVYAPGTNIGNSLKGNQGTVAGKDSTATIVLAATVNWTANTGAGNTNTLTVRGATLELVSP